MFEVECDREMQVGDEDMRGEKEKDKRAWSVRGEQEEKEGGRVEWVKLEIMERG